MLQHLVVVIERTGVVGGFIRDSESFKNELIHKTLCFKNLKKPTKQWRFRIYDKVVSGLPYLHLQAGLYQHFCGRTLGALGPKKWDL